MILVTGATGTVGRKVVRQLVDAGAQFRAMIHHSDKVDRIEGPGVEIVQADYENADSLVSAMHGVDSLFLVAPAGMRQAQHEVNMTDAAVKAKVKQIVKLSVLGASPFSPILTLRHHWESEKYIENSGIPFTFIRPNNFMQNLLRMSQSISQEGKLYAAMKLGRVSMIDARDIAAVSVATLTDDAHVFRTYEITGPEALDYNQVAEKLSRAIGRQVTYVDIPLEQFRQSMIEAGMAEPRVNDMVTFAEYYSESLGETVTSALKWVLGRSAIHFDEFARDYSSLFIAEIGSERAA